MTHRQRECPGWLDEDGRREWRRLDASGLVNDSDPETIAAYCFTLTLWRKMRTTVDQLRDQGSSSWTTRDGHEQPHPALAIEAQLAADLLMITDALDLEPNGRQAPRPSRVLIVD